MTGSAILKCLPAAFDRKDAAAYLALSVSTFERLVRQRLAPQPRHIASHRVAWIRAELDAWLSAQPVSELLPPPNTGALKPHSSRRLLTQE